MKHLYVEVRVTKQVTITREHESGKDTSTSWTVVGCSLHNEDGYKRLPITGVKKGDKVVIVYCIYSTGDSFSHAENGSFEFLGVFKTRKKAQKYKNELEKKTDFSVPWNGFFESLTTLAVQEYILQ